MINLDRFSRVKEIILPIVDGWGQIDGRKFNFPDLSDGWYKIRSSSTAEVERKATATEVSKVLENQKVSRVYALGEEGIVTNFDSFHRLGLNEAVHVHFLNLPLFEIAKVIRWEDKRFYYYEPEVVYQRNLVRVLKERFEKGERWDDIKGITPELVYYLLVANIERENYREAERLLQLKISDQEREKRMKQFQSSLSGRIQWAVEQGGGKLVNFTKANKGSYLVTWQIGEQIVKSTINDRFQILSAGFCLSGDDRKHTLTSVAQLAKMFQDRNPLYITRE